MMIKLISYLKGGNVPRIGRQGTRLSFSGFRTALSGAMSPPSIPLSGHFLRPREVIAIQCQPAQNCTELLRCSITRRTDILGKRCYSIWNCCSSPGALCAR
jgi:hypothetical protein